MKFGNGILCLALAAASGTTTTVSAFGPSHLPSKGAHSLRMGRDLIPKDLIASNIKLRQAYTITNTLRWEIRSTLTSEEEAASKTEEPAKSTEEEEDAIPPFAEQMKNGIWDIQNAEQHNNWLQANPDKLMVIKFFAPWCRACKSVEPKFVQISRDPKYADIPIIFAQMSVQHNKQYVKSLGIMALPSMQIYAGSEGLVENFPCGPSKIPMLKRKLTETIKLKVDPVSMKLQVDCTKPENSEAAPCRTRSLAVFDEAQSSEIDEVISDERKEENLVYLRTGVPYFKDFDDDNFYDLMDKAKLVTFEQGDIIMRQGVEGSMFYVIESGEVEIMVKTAFEDPLTTPPGYLGAVINVFGPHNYFGERALITHEPRAASIRAVQKTRCFAFDVKDIPTSSVLSGTKAATTERMAEVNSKYGTDVYDIDMISNQFSDVALESQHRGSVNTPEAIRGVDVDEDYVVPPAAEDDIVDGQQQSGLGLDANDRVIEMLIRFKQIRRASKCFEYIMKARPNFGDTGEARRRALLVSKLTRSQREEFSDLFKIIDTSGDGKISVLELRRAMESVGDTRSDDELHSMINNANPYIDGNEEIDFREFMGVMAEAEFYYLFMDTFEMLDVNNTGFVMAGDLDRVLCGVRDLISDDRMSIIDTQDMDMQVDYETYADMLLGKPL